MNYEQLEQSLVERLNSGLVDAGFEARIQPEVVTEYEAAKKSVQVGCVFVGYRNSTFRSITDKPTIVSTDVMAQNEVVNVELVFQNRKLRGSNGLFKMIEIAKLLMLGYKPADCTKIFMVRMEPERYEEQLWSYTLVVGAEALIVEHDEEELGAALTRITLDHATTNENQIIE